MAFNNQEQEIIRWGLQNGKSRQEVETAISNYRTGYIPPKQAQPEQSNLGSQLAERAKTFGKEAVTLGTLGTNTLTPQDFNAVGQDRTLATLQGLNRAAQSPIRMAGAVGGAIGDVFGAGLQATGLDKPIGQALAPIAQSDPVQKAVEVFKSLPQDTQDVLGAIVNATNIPIAGAGAKVAGQAIDTGASLVAKGLDAVPTSKLSLSGLDEIAQNSLKKDISSLLTATRSISNKAKLAEQKGVNLNEILSDPQIYRGIKVENAKIVPDEAIKVVDDRISQLMDAKKNILPEVDKIVPKQSREVLRTKAYEDIKGKFTPADEADIKSAIDKQIDALPKEMSVSEIDAFRARARASARDAKGLQKRSSEYSALENSARDTVFNLTDNLPVANAQDFKAINDYIKQMIETQGFLDKTLRNQVVKGGRLRNYAMRTVGAIAGAKGGALGAIAGSEIGGLVADIITNNQLGSSFKMNLIRNITDDPAILKQAEDLLKGIQGLTPNKSLQNTANSTIKTSSISNTVQPEGGIVNELINNPMRGSVTPSEFLPKREITPEIFEQNRLYQEAQKRYAEQFGKIQDEVGSLFGKLKKDSKGNVIDNAENRAIDAKIKEYAPKLKELTPPKFEDFVQKKVEQTTKQSFKEATKLTSVWNKIIKWNDLNIGTVMWHSGREWKLVPKGATFDDIAERSYEPIAEFHTQEELWKYIKDNNLVSSLPKKKVGSEPIKVYHGTNADFEKFSTDASKRAVFGKGVYFTENKTLATNYGKNIKDATISPKAKILDLSEPLTKQQVEKIASEIGYSGEATHLYGNKIKGETKSPFDALAEYARKNGETKQQLVERIQKAGYDGVKNEQWGQKTYAIYNENVIKTTPKLSPLEQEAKKYKSAEEFVKAKTNAYHGTPNKEFDEFKLDFSKNSQNETRGLGVWVTPQESVAKVFSNEIQPGFMGMGGGLKDVGGTVMPVHLKLKNPKVYKSTKGMESILDEIEKLEKEKPSITRTSPSFNSDAVERQMLVEKRDAITKKIKELKKEYQRDAFEHFMDDRDQFAFYDYSGKPNTKPSYWQERMMANDVPKTNKAFIDYLKKQGHDGIIIKGTKYDAKETGHETIDQIVSFDPQNVLTRKQLTDIWEKANKK